MRFIFYDYFLEFFEDYNLLPFGKQIIFLVAYYDSNSVHFPIGLFDKH